MWLIFMAVCIAAAIAGLVVWWIGNKIYLSIRRENMKFEQELKALEKKEKKRHEE